VNVDNWRRREWAPAIEAAGIEEPTRPYDMRATFISDALHAGVPVFTVAKIAGTSVRMIEKSYGRLLDGATADIAARLDALDAVQQRDADERSGR
jgi:integrase